MRAGRAYPFFCSTLAVVAAGFRDLNSAQVLERLWAAVVPVTGVALAHPALVFPRDTGWVRRWPNSRYVLWLPCQAAFERVKTQARCRRMPPGQAKGGTTLEQVYEVLGLEADSTAAISPRTDSWTAQS